MFFLVVLSELFSGASGRMNRGCKMKPDELTNGTKPVLKKQSGERKEEREQQRMNDGNNDEFSAAKKTGRGHKGSVFTV